MPWTYSQTTGTLTYNGQHIAQGYSGYHYGLNNPEFEAQGDVGPIPRGRYRMRKIYSPHYKPPVIELVPHMHSAMGRSDFRIHGDNSEQNFTASRGCIILKKQYRLIIADSADDMLEATR
ncbi:MAG: DUF5675 family protein [Pseudomonadota bacterium]